MGRGWLGRFLFGMESEMGVGMVYEKGILIRGVGYSRRRSLRIDGKMNVMCRKVDSFLS
jgi:hypothetical protein